MNPSNASTSTRLKVGFFALLGLALIGTVTVVVNDRPFWWRGCKMVFVNIEDATGLKYKSPVRSLGLQIGYINSVELSEAFVRLSICITAPVEVLPETQAALRGEGFLGDKFLELKPVRGLGKTKRAGSSKEEIKEAPTHTPAATTQSNTSSFKQFMSDLIPQAFAADKEEAKEIPMAKGGQDIQVLVEKVNGLVTEMTQLTSNLKEGINPADLRKTLQQLNTTLENASKTLSPEGNLTMTARRALAKLEDAIEQLRQIMTRINEGKGSLGMLLNDPSYAEEIKMALKNLNKFLNRAGSAKFIVNVGGEQIPAYDGARGYFQLGVWVNDDRYYLVGATIDPRGKVSQTTNTTEANGTSTTVKTTQSEKSGLNFTVMLGKRLFSQRVDLSLGVLHGDATATIGFQLGPNDNVDMFRLTNDVYGRSYAVGGDTQTKIDWRPKLIARPIGGLLSSVYVSGGLDSIRKVGGKWAYFVGTGITFDDEDIKLLFSFK